MREQLSADHPIRRFLVPFTFGAININDLARRTLVMPDSWIPRAYPLDDEGLQLAWSTAFELLPGGAEVRRAKDGLHFIELVFNREAYIESKREQGLSTPYYDQALRYWLILKRFVKGYLAHYYGEGETGDLQLAADEELRRFTLHIVNGIQALAGAIPPGGRVRDPMLAPDWERYRNDQKREIITNILTRFCDLVTAGHEQVGQVQAYAQDASFCSFSWPKSLRHEGALAGPKEVALGQASIMALTSTPMPRLLNRTPEDNWSYLFPASTEEDRSKLNAIFDRFQEDLNTFSVFCDDYNAQASQRAFPNNFGLWAFNPRFLETSVSI
eukprot:TRINITY_DN22059_c0_g1_i1.p2 TRINITY_DN22059_c0_g1~~TRINITY_DN22059_c0_g1_i1.p2  ORF type:complete len:328 (-),score=37.34 TRINITY_DN22059_c0_g1_i1:99-1082(-)